MIVAHSLGGIYALYLIQYLNNVKGLILLEPTTKEIILNPPRTPDYLVAENQQVTLETLKQELNQCFDKQDAQTILESLQKPPYNHGDDFQEIQQKNFLNSIKTELKSPKNLKTVIFTQSYRADEYYRSEYFNSETIIKSIGNHHYIQWHHPKEIAEETMKIFELDTLK